jgi:hypothetical protein
MKYLAILIIPFCATAAHAVEMPEELVGSWCQAEEMSFNQCEPEKANFFIERKLTHYTNVNWVSGGCKPLSVRKSGKRSWIIKERCMPPHGDGSGTKPKVTTSYYTITDGTYLGITTWYCVKHPKNCPGV